ncbi:hypothetical protein PG984_015203 [Apiospora sp. TS-2023a]
MPGPRKLLHTPSLSLTNRCSDTSRQYHAQHASVPGSDGATYRADPHAAIGRSAHHAPAISHADRIETDSLTTRRQEARLMTGPGPRMPHHADGHRLGSTPGRTENQIIETNYSVGKRKALEKKAKSSRNTATEIPVKSEALVECWDMELECISLIPASRTKQLYNARDPLLLQENRKDQRDFKVIFPLCPDHLITLLQFNVLRALAVNRTLISGILATPLDCGEETIHVISCPTTDPKRLLPPSLLPTALQQTVLHGDWIDIFPCATARDSMILAAGTFDEDELWADCIGGLYEGFPDDEVERRGIIAWSPPWDISGWEMSEGFIRKWGWLFGGMIPDGLEATNRWRRERGEEPFGNDVIGVARRIL